MKKECVLLSDGNLMLMCELKDKCKKYNIDLSPCKYIFEMLNKYNSGTNAIVIEQCEKFGDFEQYVSQEILKKTYYFKQDKFVNAMTKQTYNNFDEFLTSGEFDHKIQKKFTTNYETFVTERLEKIGVVMNSWKARFIKYILCEMKNLGTKNVCRKIIESVGASKEVEIKHIYDSLRPTLKEFTLKLNAKSNEQIKPQKVKQMIDSLYEYVFSK